MSEENLGKIGIKEDCLDCSIRMFYIQYITNIKLRNLISKLTEEIKELTRKNIEFEDKFKKEKKIENKLL